MVPAISCSYGVGPAGASPPPRAPPARPPPPARAPAARATGGRRGRRATGEVLDRPVHQLNRADAGIDHVLQGRLRALVCHRAVAVGDDSELHPAKLRVWLPLREHRGEEWTVE